jgi:putative nucleotidyltransferase with HDIG domain
MTTPRQQLADELLRRFAAALRSGQLYSKNHPIITRNHELLTAAIQQFHDQAPSIVIGIVGDEIIVDDVPVTKADALGGLIRRLKQIAVERITIERGVTGEEVAALVDAVTAMEVKTGEEVPPPFPALKHVRVGRVTVQDRVESDTADMATFRRMYSQAVTVAEAVWDSAKTEGQPDPNAARQMIDGLAQAVSQNRTALLALATLKNYDNYTFTHMVNVSILTMGQARALGIDGSLLREFGLAALMHDIGKVKTPLEVLNKPGRLTDEEFVVMRRHVVDGAEILRATPDIPTLAAVFAFEHHLRLDGTGYPFGVQRAALNLGTMLCSIADVFDAMRSQRKYQAAQPTDRILEVLKYEDGAQFDRHLVRRFVQLVGVYPAGNLVRLNTGEIAVVTKAYAPDPHRPRVKVVMDRAGARLDFPYEVNLWEPNGEGQASSIVAPLDSAAVGIDPLSLL